MIGLGVGSCVVGCIVGVVGRDSPPSSVGADVAGCKVGEEVTDGVLGCAVGSSVVGLMERVVGDRVSACVSTTDKVKEILPTSGNPAMVL